MSSQWIRVAEGLRLVASAAASRSTQQANHVVGRVAQHGAQVVVNARAAAQTVVHEQRQHDGVNGSNRYPESSQMKQEEAEEELTTPKRTIGTNLDTSYSSSFQEQQQHSSDNNVNLSSSKRVNGASLTKEGHQELIDKPMSISRTLKIAVEREQPESVSPKPETLPDETQEDVNSNSRLKEGRAVPSSRLGRAVGFAGLGARLAFGTAAEAAGRLFGASNNQDSVLATDANADRLAASLCRMRGAALKMGQMLSIQDETLLPPALSRALRQVRQGADAMPRAQLLKQLTTQLGTNYSDVVKMDETPFAAASIGQVHRASVDEQQVVLKVQYPGVADSIDSDLNNLQTLISLTGLAPPGLFLENVIRVGRTELKQECDYIREAENQQRFKKLVQEDSVLHSERFVVPGVVEKLTTSQILTSEYAPGGTIDKVVHLDQEERNRIGRNIMRLTMQELFVWRFMQTDPNWGNFLYDVGTRTTYLIDFGAAREYSKSFVDGYLRIVWAAANCDADTIMDQSHKMGFLTGDENEIMMEAHKASGFTVGEPFRSHEPFDFRGSNISSRLSRESSVFLQHRLTPPPEEVYTLHRKLAGSYMLCIKLGAVINCRDMLEEIVTNHVFEDDTVPPAEYDVNTAELQQA